MVRKLHPDEALWARVVETVKPFMGRVERTQNAAIKNTVIKNTVPKNAPSSKGVKNAPSPVQSQHKAAPQHKAGPIEAAAPMMSMADALKLPIKKPSHREHFITSAKPNPIVNPPSSDGAAHHLDGHWERRFNRGVINPDVHIDLHGENMSGAYQRLDHALAEAVHIGARVILLVTGKARSHDRQSGSGRGAIRAVIADWLAASRHASHIADVRGAHPRHGGNGAIYIILRRKR
ncbi:hypothetical protein LPB140_05805 [Sphingorhabdus lutea]|uniref:Smr domain-containing protein n=1 Tax=Sphingorhabdus lutea TaxID=1913578 RepID=A0A1L3JB88_9SPHN|nr:Smr/MutS family protein [Sphingorhabdus lutea]APG62388.1 hypothetical protein LPB140_05805 [Sphingorhabdus lutea]